MGFCKWLLSSNNVFRVLLYCGMNQCFISFYSQYSIRWILHILLIHSSVDGHRLFSLFCYYDKYCYEHSRTGFYAHTCFHFSWVYSRIAGSYSNCIFSLLKKCQTISQSSCTIFLLVFKDLFFYLL